MTKVTNETSPKALGDVRVLDLAGELGVYCTKLLADLGADVIRVEPPGGDDTRRLGPFYHDDPDPEKSLYFFQFNTNKRGITLNLETASGREVFRKLVKTSDILVETFPPGYLAGLQLDYEALAEIHPRLIHTSITGFGQTGPYKDFKTADIVGLAMGGMMNLMGWPDRAPTSIGASQGYFAAALLAANGTLLALFNRDCTGKGQHVDVSMQQAVALDLETALPHWDLNRYVLKRGGLHHTPIDPSLGRAFRRCHAVKDGYVNCLPVIQSFEEWDRLLDWMDSRGTVADLRDERYRDMAFLRANLDHFEEVFGAFLATFTRREIFEEAHFRGVRKLFLMPLNTAKDIYEDPHLAARDFFVEVTHPELGEPITYPGGPYRFSRTPWTLRHPAPSVGEHNQEILEGELGISPKQLETLKAENAI